MDTVEFIKLRRRDALRVSFGRFGTQLAIVGDVTRSGNVRVFKWSAKSRKWTGPTRITAGEVIEKLRHEGAFRDCSTLPPAYDRLA